MLSLEKGTLCTLIGLQNRTDLNGLKCTVGNMISSKKGRIPVTVVCNGKEKHILVKRENLHPYVSVQDVEHEINNIAGFNELSGVQSQLTTNTVNDVKEIIFKYDSLLEPLEEAINHRNHGRFVMAEQLFKKLLAEAEDLCGKRSVRIASFLKSFGILRYEQRRWSEAEDLFARANELRPADCEGNGQGTQTLEYLYSAQLEGRLFKKASGTLSRMKELQHCIRPGIDSDPYELEKTLERRKESPAQCVVCCRCSILSACAGCNLTVYCSRGCQKIHWKIHKRVCRSTISLNRNCNVQSPKSPANDASLFEVIENSNNDTDILSSSVLRNAQATNSVTSSCPTEMDHTLLSALADAQQTYFFCMNEVTSSALLETNGGGGGRRRFMATVGVFSCITVFVWSKSTSTCTDANSPGPCFGAHVSLGALLRGLRACKHAKIDIDRALSPLLLKLRECFQGCKQEQDVIVTLVGGHRAMDYCQGLEAMFPGDTEKWSFAWHVKTACKAALDEMSNQVLWKTHLLLRF
mmetsp:Transcript_17648/g.21591  ORF Transcript_17648/g.21591 Transcript_17648/m.21591 type:complete len:523 (+) Transcript_17648:236-1804(+)